MARSLRSAVRDEAAGTVDQPTNISITVEHPDLPIPDRGSTDQHLYDSRTPRSRDTGPWNIRPTST